MSVAAPRPSTISTSPARKLFVLAGDRDDPLSGDEHLAFKRFGAAAIEDSHAGEEGV